MEAITGFIILFPVEIDKAQTYWKPAYLNDSICSYV